MNPEDQGISLSPTIRDALERLFRHDSRWTVETEMSSPGFTVVARNWPDNVVDRLFLLSLDTAYAIRLDPLGRQEPWAINGTLDQVIAQARELHPPEPKDAQEDGR